MENPQAFPNTGNSTWDLKPVPGMTLLDYFAAAAVPSVMHLCARDTLAPGETLEQSFARKSYAIAAAMLNERQSHEG